MVERRILVVEPDGRLAADLAATLASLGYRMLGPSATVEAALEAIGRTGPDLVLVDFDPCAGAIRLETLRRIRSGCGVPLVCIVGPGQEMALRAAGFTEPHEYVVKPAAERDLAIAIELALYRRKIETELHASRAALLESEQRFQAVFDSMAEGVALHELVYDASGAPVDYRILSVNPAYERHTGLKAERCVGRLSTEVYSNPVSPYLEIFAQVALTREPVTFETYFAPLGRYFLVSVASPKPGTFATLFLDITERKRTEEALREAEERYRTIFDGALEGIFRIAPDGRVLAANPALATMLGYDSPAQFIADFTEPEQVWLNEADRRRMIETVERDGAVRALECQLRRRDGTAFWASLSERKVTGPDGATLYYEGFIEDIVERKRAADALRESEKRYRTVVDAASDGIVLHDRAGRIRTWSAGAERILGVSAAQAMGETPESRRWHSIHEDGSPWPGNDHPSSRVLATGQPCRDMIMGIHRADGALVWISINATPIFSEGEATPSSVVVTFSDITVRKQMEDALRESEHWLRESQRVSRIGSYVMDVERDSWVSSEGLDEIFGAGADFPHTTAGWSQLLHPDDRAAMMKYLTGEVFGQRHAFDREYRIVRQNDGQMRWVHGRGVVLAPTSTRGLLMTGTIQDITERKQAEEALRQSDERFRQMFYGAADALYIHDDEGRLVDVNQVACDSLGYSREELLRMSVTDMEAGVLPPDLNAIWERVARGESLTVEGAHRRRDGSTFPVEVHVAALASGDRPLFMAVVRDLTERKRAEERLRASERRLSVAISATADAIWEWNLRSGEAFYSPRWYEMLGYADQQLPMSIEAWRALCHPDDVEQAMDRIQATLSSPGAGGYSVELRMRHKDGSWLWILSRGNVVERDEAGNPVRLAGTNTDITVRRALEEQLRQAQKMESVGRLAGGVAHDFNNLLTVINGYSDLALEGLEEGSPSRAALQEIRKAGARAAELTQQLLAFSRRQPVRLRTLDLNATVRETEKLLRRVLGEDIDLVCALDPALHPVQADPGQIHQVIMNLAVNARDAMPSGGRLVIETGDVELDRRYAADHFEVQPGWYAMLSFRDSGSGMNHEVLDHVFEPFFTTKEPGKGTGLGLATVFGIVKQAGGHVSVESEPGRGSTFRVYLPRGVQTGTAPDAGPAVPTNAGGSETILVVEDQSEVRGLTRTLLSSRGYSVIEAANGEEALRLAQSMEPDRIDLLLTDVVMPRMGGRALAARLRELRPNIRVLFVSGYPASAAHDLGDGGPPIEYLPKPFTAEALALKVREVLDRVA